jgi:hypothetical protein
MLFADYVPFSRVLMSANNMTFFFRILSGKLFKTVSVETPIMNNWKTVLHCWLVAGMVEKLVVEIWCRNQVQK